MYRRALAICLSLVALFAVSAPTQAAVAGYTVGVNNPKCSTAGYGKVVATAHFSESGGTGTNYFQSIATLQQLRHGTWKDASQASTSTSDKFKATKAGHNWDVVWKYPFSAAQGGKTYRLTFVYEFWHKKQGPDQLLFSSTRSTPNCKAG